MYIYDKQNESRIVTLTDSALNFVHTLNLIHYSRKSGMLIAFVESRHSERSKQTRVVIFCFLRLKPSLHQVFEIAFFSFYWNDSEFVVNSNLILQPFLCNICGHVFSHLFLFVHSVICINVVYTVKKS